MIFLVFCIVSLFYDVFVLFPGTVSYIFSTAIARYSLFVLKMPLNNSQLTNFGGSDLIWRDIQKIRSVNQSKAKQSKVKLGEGGSLCALDPRPKVVSFLRLSVRMSGSCRLKRLSHAWMTTRMTWKMKECLRCRIRQRVIARFSTAAILVASMAALHTTMAAVVTKPSVSQPWVIILNFTLYDQWRICNEHLTRTLPFSLSFPPLPLPFLPLTSLSPFFSSYISYTLPPPLLSPPFLFSSIPSAPFSFPSLCPSLPLYPLHG